LRALQARKHELVLESELNRQVLRVECGKLAFKAGQFRRGYAWAHSAWNWAVPLAGFLLARKQRKVPGGVFAKGSFLITALRAGWKVWKAMRGARPEPRPER
jgi:hypothetical protein